MPIIREYANTKKWLYLSVGCLLLGGLLSLFLVVGRVPMINQLINDPHFAKRMLVVHVTLTLGCWFFGYIATLFYLLPGKARGAKRLWISILGIVVFCIGGIFFEGEPILSNYIPVTHNSIFLTGFALFILGPTLALIDKRFFSHLQPTDSFLDAGSFYGIKTMATTYLLGVVVLIITLLTTPMMENHFAYYEIVFWGAGHVFQLANVSALLSVWLIFYRRMTGQSLLNPMAAKALFGFQMLLALASLSFLYGGTSGPYYYPGFMLIMRWTTWPSTSLIMLLLTHRFLTDAQFRQASDRPEFRAMLGSAGLMLLGYFLGAHIDSSTTLIPAHYHATIGSVTLAFMTMTYVLFEQFGHSPQNKNISQWLSRQPLIFGAGQFIFSSGFAFAGVHGLGRKVYGSEQMLRSSEQYFGLGIMGIGGALALSGGALFFVLLYKLRK